MPVTRQKQHILFGLAFSKPEILASFNEELFGQRLCCLRVHSIFLVGIWGTCAFWSGQFLQNFGMMNVTLCALTCILLAILCWFVFHSRSWIKNRSNLLTPCYFMHAFIGFMPFYIIMNSGSIYIKSGLVWLLILLQILTSLLLHLPFGVVLLSAWLNIAAIGLLRFAYKSADAGNRLSFCFEGTALMMGLVTIYLVQTEVFSNFIARQNLSTITEENVELRAQELKKSYLREMIHEIGTPLMVLSLGNESLKELGETYRAVSHVAKTNTKALEMLTRLRERALDITKQSDGVLMRPNYRKVNIRYLVFRRCSRIMTAYNSSKSHKRVRVTYHVEANVPKYTKSDHDFIWDMLCCLLSNAKKFTTEGKIKTVVSYSEAERTIYFKVSDTGRGVNKEYQDHLFKPFTQFQAGSGGTGLGLYSVKLKAEALDGKVGYINISEHRRNNTTLDIFLQGMEGFEDFDSGSIFWFSIPYISEDEKPTTSEVQGSKTSVGSKSHYRSSSFSSTIGDRRRSSSRPPNNVHLQEQGIVPFKTDKQRSLMSVFSIQRKKAIVPNAREVTEAEIPDEVKSDENFKSEEFTFKMDVSEPGTLRLVNDNEQTKPSEPEGVLVVRKRRSRGSSSVGSPAKGHLCFMNHESVGKLGGLENAPKSLYQKMPSTKSLAHHQPFLAYKILKSRDNSLTDLTRENASRENSGVAGANSSTLVSGRKRNWSNASSDFGGESMMGTMKTQTVLLIEDEMTILKMISRMLSKKGYPVDTAENGRVGLEKLLASEYTCVFCDITMPEMDGYETLERFREWESKQDPDTYKHQYICALSANSDETSKSKAKRVGFDNFLTKPTNFKVLLEEIGKAERAQNIDNSNSPLQNV